MSQKTTMTYSAPPDYSQAASDHDSAPMPKPQSAAQLGEQYRSELYANCAHGNHQPARKYGLCGIITAAFLFPIGLICLFTDSYQVCERCGVRLNPTVKATHSKAAH